MTCILFVIGRIHSDQVKCNYLKKKIFVLNFFASFLKSKSNFERFETKCDSPTLRICEITDCEKSGYLNV